MFTLAFGCKGVYCFIESPKALPAGLLLLCVVKSQRLLFVVMDFKKKRITKIETTLAVRVLNMQVNITSSFVRVPGRVFPSARCRPCGVPRELRRMISIKSLPERGIFLRYDSLCTSRLPCAAWYSPPLSMTSVSRTSHHAYPQICKAGVRRVYRHPVGFTVPGGALLEGSRRGGGGGGSAARNPSGNQKESRVSAVIPFIILTHTRVLIGYLSRHIALHSLVDARFLP